MYPQIGLRIPENFDALLTAGGQVALPGYVCWSKRHQVLALRVRLEEMLSKALGQPLTIKLEGNYAYPPSADLLTLNMATTNSVLMILMMGIILVPSLLLDEKETRTMQALLVSPASIGQVVLEKPWREPSISW